MVLCQDPDRLSRNLSDLLLLADEFAHAGIRLEFITQETDASPEGKMFFAMRGAVAEYERAKIRERTIRGRLQKARQGKVISRAAAPYGYRFDPVASTLVINEDEAMIVRMAFHLYISERISLAKLADRLNRLGLVPPRGGRRWRFGYLAQLLRNEAYSGTLWQNRHHTIKVPGKGGQKPGHRTVELPKSEQIPTSVPPTISRETFDAAQKRLQENTVFASRNTRHEDVLAGLLKHSCGRAMGGKTRNGYAYYSCFGTNRENAPINDRGEPMPCAAKWVNGNSLEEIVWDRVTGLLRHPDLLIRELENLTRPTSVTREALEEELAQTKKRLNSLPEERRRLVEGYRKGLFADFMMRAEMERVQGEQSAAEGRCSELETQLVHLDKALTFRGQIEKLARTLSRGLDQMTFTERRELIRLLVDEIIYDEGNVTIKTIIDPAKCQLYPVSQRVG